MITWEQVPLKEQEKLRSAFCNNPSIKQLETIAADYLKRGDYIKALETKKEITAQWEYVKEVHLKTYHNTVQEAVKLSEIGLPEDKLQVLIQNMLIIFMSCDIIETAYLNANEVLKKFNPDYSLDNFNDIKSVIDVVKNHLKFLQSETGYMDDFIWGDSCDKQYDMIKNKAKSIISKKNNLERWGQNMKKYIDGTL